MEKRSLEWLKEIRRQKNMTTYQVSEMTGISQPHYSMMENGVRGVPVHAAKKIASVLEFDWTRFYEESEEKTA